MKIIRGKIAGAKKVVVYGPEGIGKSTFASQFPEPLFIDTEGSTKDMDIARTEPPSSWAMLLDQVRYVKSDPDIYLTLVIDTADWAEMLCVETVCGKAHKSGIEDFNYGKGYVYLAEEFGRLLNLLTEVVDRGINVVITAHAKMRKFEQPDEMGAYDRWELKLQKQTAPILKEWADMVLFANYKTIVVNVDGQGAQNGKNKAQGGRRVMYTSHHPCWDAKNRYGLPEEVPFEYGQIAHIIGPGSVAVRRESAAVAMPQQEEKPPAPMPEPEQMGLPIENQAAAENKPKQVPEDNRVSALYIDELIPKSLRDLMIAHTVTEDEIQRVCEAKGYVPLGTPLREYDVVNPGIVDGLLVASWAQVKAAVMSMRETESIPFN